MRFLVICALHVCACAAQDWTRFRGPNGSGVSDGAGLPAVFGPDRSLLWRTEIPPGHSSPVVTGSRLFVTAWDGDTLYLLCLHRDTGRVLWRRQMGRDRRQLHHANNGPATPTPATDGSQVYAFFPDTGLASYSLEGDLQWMKKLGPFVNGHGMASSPITAGERVILLCDQARGSFLIALDRRTGEVCWRADRNNAGPSYSTPALLAGSIVVFASNEAAAYDLRDGERIWSLPGLPYRPNASPVVTADGALILASGQAYPAGMLDKAPSYDQLLKEDRNQDGLLSREELNRTPLNLFLQLDADGDGLVSRAEYAGFLADASVPSAVLEARPPLRAGGAPRVLWRHSRYAPDIASPLVYRDIVYLLRKGGILAALDARSGALLKEGRVLEAPGEYFASPVAADGKLYLVNHGGDVAVLRAGPDWAVEAVNKLGEDVYATPAIAGGRLFVRTIRALYCFGGPPFRRSGAFSVPAAGPRSSRFPPASSRRHFRARW